MMINKNNFTHIFHVNTKTWKIKDNILNLDNVYVKKELQLVYDLTNYYKKEEKYNDKKDLSIRSKIIRDNLKKEDLTCNNPNCNNIVKFIKNQNKFANYCCYKCSNSDESKKKSTEESNLKKYGVRHTFQMEEFKRKSKETMLEKYGVDNSMKLDIIKEKSKRTCSLNYGVDNILKLEEMKERQQVKRFEHLKNLDKWDDGDFIEKSFITSDGYLDAYKFQEFFNCGPSIPYSKCKDLNIEYKKIVGTSLKEKEVVEYIRSIYDKEILENDRTLISKELDIVIPSKKLAIEFNGIFWHSLNTLTYDNFTKYNHKKKHLEKTEQCEMKNFKLFHIFENEWNDKKDIWKSKIALELGIIEKRIFARKCIVKEVISEEASLFLEENHLLGSCISKYNIGLYYKDELVSIMAFGTPTFNKQSQYELLRFCSSKNCKILGGASRLLKYFERNYNPKNIIAYSNRRWCNNTSDLYNILNFQYVKNIIPNYYYIENNSNAFVHQNKYQNDKVKLLLGKNYDNNLSSIDNCIFNLKLSIIYDSGSLEYIKEF